MRGVEAQIQGFAEFRREVTPYSHGEHFSRLAADVAVGVAAKAFADIGGDAEQAFTSRYDIYVFGAYAQGHFAARGQRCCQWQADIGSSVKLDLTRIGCGVAQASGEKTHGWPAKEASNEQVGGM